MYNMKAHSKLQDRRAACVVVAVRWYQVSECTCCALHAAGTAKHSKYCIATAAMHEGLDNTLSNGRRTDLCIDFDVQAHEVTAAVACELVLHAGVTPAPALQLVKKVGHDLQ